VIKLILNAQFFFCYSVELFPYITKAQGFFETLWLQVSVHSCFIIELLFLELVAWTLGITSSLEILNISGKHWCISSQI